MKSLKEKWLSIVQSTREKGENEIGGFSIVTPSPFCYKERTKLLTPQHSLILERLEISWTSDSSPEITLSSSDYQH